MKMRVLIILLNGLKKQAIPKLELKNMNIQVDTGRLEKKEILDKYWIYFDKKIY